MAQIKLGFNCNCFTNRFDEPEEWTKICQHMGVRNVMFSTDLIDPYWPWDLQRRLCDRTLASCDKYGIRIQCSFGGHHGHQHYLGHPDPQCRREAEKFFRAAIRQTAYLRGKSFGTCFAILTQRCQDNIELRSEIIQEALATYERLAHYAAELGLEGLAYEMTSVDRETCATFAENDRILEIGRGFKVPLRICLDLGHRNMSASEDEQDHLAWIRRYGAASDVIDCQQTDKTASRHWPFTSEFNEQGVIRGDEVIAAIHASGAKEILLAFEIRSPAFFPQEHRYLQDLRKSVDYWRQWIDD